MDTMPAPATFDLDAWVSRAGALDLEAVPWEDVARYPLASDAVRALRYMQDIESHTIIYLRSLLATRAIDDPEVATFLACWLHEETFHGLALARFLEAAGYRVDPRPQGRSREPLLKRLESAATALLSRAWPDFCAVHMIWGAINELTTLTGYRRLADVAGHPVLSGLLRRITVDESRHFFFLLSPGRHPPAAAGGGARRAPARRPLLGARRKRRAAARGDRVPRRLSLRRR
jgi:hypothetical protein